MLLPKNRGGTRRIINVLLLSLCLAGCGPSDFEKRKLALEEQKYKDAKAAKEEAQRKEEEEKKKQKELWMNCRVRAETDYNSEFSMWGEPVPGKPGQRQGRADQLENMKRRRQQAEDKCDRNFPKGISW